MRKTLLGIVFLLFVVGCTANEGASEKTRVAPAVELTGLDQAYLLTSDVEKPMMISFWASWCQYCNAEIPILDALYEEYKDRVEFVSINITYDDNVSGAKSFVAKHQLRMPVYLDVDAVASESFLIQAVPSIVTVDENGAIVTQRTGALGKQAEQFYREQMDLLLTAAH